MWLEEYNNLNETEQAKFKRVVHQLLLKTFIVRFKYDVREKTIVRNPDYTFADRYHSVIDEYLKLSGLRMHRYSTEGVMQLYSKINGNHKIFDKPTTVFLYALRLIYYEEMDKVTLRNEVIVTIADIIERLKALGIYETKPVDKVMDTTFSTIRNYNIIDKIEGAWNSPETQVIIYPTILYVVPDEKINEIYEWAKQKGESEESVETTEEDEVTED